MVWFPASRAELRQMFGPAPWCGHGGCLVGFASAVLLPSRTHLGICLAGMWQLLLQRLRWGAEDAGVEQVRPSGRHHRLTVAARAFAGRWGRIFPDRARIGGGVMNAPTGICRRRSLEIGSSGPRPSSTPTRSCGCGRTSSCCALLSPAALVGSRSGGDDRAAPSALQSGSPTDRMRRELMGDGQRLLRRTRSMSDASSRHHLRSGHVHGQLRRTVVARHERCWDLRRTIRDPALHDRQAAAARYQSATPRPPEA